LTDYAAPIEDFKFILRNATRYDEVAALPGNEEFGWDMIDAVLEEAGRLAAGVIAPLNRTGDLEGSVLADGKVTTPPGWKAAYDELAAGGWIGLAVEPELGGQGMPKACGAAVSEMFEGASMAFALCNILTQGAIEALVLNASEEIKARYLPKLVSGEWTGTMNLTEPQAGSDLAALRATATPESDRYLIRGQKIFISYGDHDLTDNIVHLVLARLPDAPPGVKGISLFVVPKFLVGDDGSLGAANDIACVSLEHKLGIHASPTAVMSYGDKGGAFGWLVGEANRGLEYMFVMMNRARFEVGVQGIGIAERAYQQARAYARERVQGRPMGREQGATIVEHPDVKRMLLSMKSRIDAVRAIGLDCAARMDIAEKTGDRAIQEEIEFLIPIVKGWGTELGVEIASLGMQVHGGTGYIEETGAAQHFRDARITTIYEGTTGIQSADLMFRKTMRDGGAVAKRLIAGCRATLDGLATADAPAIISAARSELDGLDDAVDRLVRLGNEDPAKVAAVADPNLHLWGIVLGAVKQAEMASAAHAARAAGEGNADYLDGRMALAEFYRAFVLPMAQGFRGIVEGGGETVVAANQNWL